MARAAGARQRVGLDTGGESVPYVAGWGEDGALAGDLRRWRRAGKELARPPGGLGLLQVGDLALPFFRVESRGQPGKQYRAPRDATPSSCPATSTVVRTLSTLDHPARGLKLRLGALGAAAQLLVLDLLGARTALARREALERAGVALLAPRRQVRGVEALAAQQRADLALARARLGRAQHAQLVLGGEAPPARALGQLGVGRRRARRSPPLAYGSLRYPAGDLRHRLQLR